VEAEMLRRVAGTFIAGLLALLPLLITISVVGFLVSKLTAWLGPGSAFGAWMRSFADVAQIRPELSYLISLVVVVVLICTIGLFAQRFTGQRASAWITYLVGRIPFINKVYNSAEQVVQLLSHKDGDAASALANVVMVRIANIRVLGMLSSAEPVLINGEPYYIVFLPSTPIPASGQNVIIPAADVEDVTISVEEMTKIIISLGSLGPDIMNAKKQLILPTVGG
jgi:uncharacterized membrane protein